MPQDIKAICEARAKEAERHYSKRGLCFSSDEIQAALRKNEVGDASLLIKAMKDKFCYDPKRKEFFRFEDCHWKRDIEEEFTAYAGRTLERAYSQEASKQWSVANDAGESEETKKTAMRLYEACQRRIERINTLRRLENALKLARKGKTDIVIKGDEWNKDPWKLQSGNMVIDLKTGEARPGTPQDYISKAAPTAWKGLDAPCVGWCMFLRAVFAENDELVEYVQKVLGSALVGTPSQQEFYIFWGEGRNGKGTILETLKEILGCELASSIKSDMLMDSRLSANGADPELLELQGKRIAWASETGDGKKLNSEKVKLFTGGDTLAGRLNYSNEIISFPPTHTLFILTNFKPRISEGDTALWDRLRLIPFERRFVDDPQAENERKKDPELKDKLLREASGILAWLVRGCLKWQQEGMNSPEIVKAFGDDYKLDQNPTQLFINERCNIGSYQETQMKPLYEAFAEWFEELYGAKAKIPSMKVFSERLQKIPGIMRDKRSRNTYFVGVSLIESSDSSRSL